MVAEEKPAYTVTVGGGNPVNLDSTAVPQPVAQYFPKGSSVTCGRGHLSAASSYQPMHAMVNGTVLTFKYQRGD